MGGWGKEGGTHICICHFVMRSASNSLTSASSSPRPPPPPLCIHTHLDFLQHILLQTSWAAPKTPS